MFGSIPLGSIWIYDDPLLIVSKKIHTCNSNATLENLQVIYLIQKAQGYSNLTWNVENIYLVTQLTSMVCDLAHELKAYNIKIMTLDYIIHLNAVLWDFESGIMLMFYMCEWLGWAWASPTLADCIGGSCVYVWGHISEILNERI